MENKTVFIKVFVKVFVKDELPKESDWYDTDQGDIYSENFTYYGVKWWLKEIEMPSEGDIHSFAIEDGYSSCDNSIQLFKDGVSYILNKLK